MSVSIAEYCGKRVDCENKIIPVKYNGKVLCPFMNNGCTKANKKIPYHLFALCVNPMELFGLYAKIACVLPKKIFPWQTTRRESYIILLLLYQEKYFLIVAFIMLENQKFL